MEYGTDKEVFLHPTKAKWCPVKFSNNNVDEVPCDCCKQIFEEEVYLITLPSGKVIGMCHECLCDYETKEV